MVEWRLVLKTASRDRRLTLTESGSQLGPTPAHPNREKKGSSYVKCCCTGKLRDTRIL